MIYTMVVPCRYGYHKDRLYLVEELEVAMENSVPGKRNNTYLVLEKEPTNWNDSKAIKVWVRGKVFGHLGYVGRQFCDSVHEIFDKITDIELHSIDVDNKAVYLQIRWDSEK